MICSRCLGSDRRRPWVVIDGLPVQDCCTTILARPGPDDVPTKDVLPLAVYSWGERLLSAPHEGLSDEECEVALAVRVGYCHASLSVRATALWEASRPQEPKSGVWCGVEGEKATRLAKCTESRLLDPMKLPTGIVVQSTLCRFVTDAGEDLTWFCSSKTFIPEDGGEYRLEFKVKKHDVYEGHRSTLISHARRLDND